ncbi:ALDH-like protein [Rhizoclosmatium globosum]|uniref:ALDH-like protein n=1 Tax=Rhizoclosmatium globosum TaxID=329046 RepID=A0A1Y2BS62_9FUNG|nr:ALDH-like protein [Rhizoclosmatium globosum]|eukprot:ORY37598.1 ALDH-like protein [Rhizoclosmatium globosum]
MNIRDSENPSQIKCWEPTSGRYLCSRPAFTRDQVKEAVAKARRAQQDFKNSSWQQRRDILTTLLDYLVREQSAICRISARCSGKTFLDATFGEIIPTAEKLLWTIQYGEEALAPEHRVSGTISFLAAARVEYVPVGVMGLIVSWNYPIHNVISPLTSAIMAGNGCVIKVSEYSGWATPWLQEVVGKVLEVHGVSRDLVTFIDGFADAGEALVETADKITFIGSPAVGKLVMRKASETLTPVVLELGGKDAAIVFNDCEYENMLKITMRGGLQNCGQNCAGLERMIVQDGIYDRLVKDVSALVGAIRLGNPFEENIDLGGVTMKSQLKIVQDLLEDAVAKGAKVQCGGKIYKDPKFPNGQFFEPTILTDITPDMRIHHEEVFGPIILIYKFSTTEEAIKIINSTEFGLGSSVFSLDYAKAEYVAKRINAGSCNINGWGFSYLCQSLPFGGVKHSGFDRFGGVEGLRGNCHIKALTTDKLGHLGIRAQVPPVLHFPIKKEAVGFQAALINILYGVGMWNKAVGVARLLKNVMGVQNGDSSKKVKTA